ncbi:MAG: cysteine--tRNA ligase, partial [Gammaproteobacteria bacterium]
ALWKAADARDHSVGTVWDSPWGKGRPGWHIECSAMSMEHLGSEFDLHGGGLDLLFPHHENELAQSHGAGCAFARHWMHVAPLRMSQEKMSKSLGNVIGIKTALAQWHPETIRHSLLSAHYRSPLDFSEKRIEESRAVLNRWYSTLESNPPAKAPPAEGQSPPYNEELEQTLLHDLNLPALMSQLSNMAHTINRKGGQPASKARLASELLFYGQQIGLLNLAPHQWFQNLESHSLISPERIAQFIIERNNARMDKDYAAADHIRQQLLDQGVELLDRTDGTDWRYLKT